VTAGSNEGPLKKFEADLRKAVGLMNCDARMSVGLAVKAAWEFVCADPHLTAQNLQRPFFLLLGALDDLTRGRLDPMLKPISFGNRPIEGTARQQAKGFVCVYIEELTRIGEGVPDACKAVASILAKHKIPIGGGVDIPAWQTVRNWRYRTSKLPPTNTQRFVMDNLREQLAIRREGQAGLSKQDLLGELDGIVKDLGGKLGLG
jgi:hypothetical protein